MINYMDRKGIEEKMGGKRRHTEDEGHVKEKIKN